MPPDFSRIEKTLTSIYHRFLLFEEAHADATVIGTLHERLPHIAFDSWPQRLQWGGIFLNGIEVSNDRPLTYPCKVEYYEPKFEIEKAAEYFSPFGPEHIVYEDEDLLVVFKTGRLSCVPGREQKHLNLRSFVTSYLGHEVHMPSRLDLSTQGLVAISKSTRMHPHLQRAFEGRKVKKRYLLDTAAAPGWTEQVLETRIGKSLHHPILRSVNPKHELGDLALTNFCVLDVSVQGTLIEASPLTGRTHQIRVHAQHLGVPIKGDNFYGGAEAPELRLLSYSISLFHPFHNRELSIAVPRDLRPEWLCDYNF